MSGRVAQVFNFFRYLHQGMVSCLTTHAFMGFADSNLQHQWIPLGLSQTLRAVVTYSMFWDGWELLNHMTQHVSGC